MESMLPNDVTDALADQSSRLMGRSTGLVVQADSGADRSRHPVLKITDDGLVIAVEETPHLSGYVDILRGDERIARHLVVFSWARDGMAAYDFKRGAHAGPAPADYERPEHAGLIAGPDAG